MSGSRLSLARKLRGLNQSELAKAVDVTPRAISKYEKEGEGLSSAKLAEIAAVLRFEPSFFYGSDVEPLPDASISFRARSKMSAKKRDQAIATSVFGTVFSDWMDSRFILPVPSIPDYSGYDPEDAARALRAEWGLGEGPVSDVIAILESHGIRVFSVTEASQEVDAYSFWDESRHRPFVFLTTSKSGERRRMDAAHELGHLVLHRRVDLTGRGTKEVERQADEFASAFLMPGRGFRSTISSNISLSEIMRVKREWKVSAFAAVVRAHTLGLLSDWQYHNMCVTMSKRGMRTREPNGIVAERSQVADKILSLARKDYGSTFAIADATGIPYSLIMGLTFHAPIDVIKGGGAKEELSSPSKKGREARSHSLRLVADKGGSN